MTKENRNMAGCFVLILLILVVCYLHYVKVERMDVQPIRIEATE